MPLQHWRARLQPVLPVIMHAAQLPSQFRLQQSVSALQLSPSVRHASQRAPRSAEQVSPEQHESGVKLHASSRAPHEPALAPHVPFALQAPPQHSASVAHAAPLR
jgi:hypothetical protein